MWWLTRRYTSNKITRRREQIETSIARYLAAMEILGAFQQRAFGSSTLIAMKIAKKLENRATVFTQSGSRNDLPVA